MVEYGSAKYKFKEYNIMEIPKNLDPKIQEILSRHVTAETVVKVDGVTGHLVSPLDEVANPPAQVLPTNKTQKPFSTFIDKSLPPGDRD